MFNVITQCKYFLKVYNATGRSCGALCFVHALQPTVGAKLNFDSQSETLGDRTFSNF